MLLVLDGYKNNNLKVLDFNSNDFRLYIMSSNNGSES